MYTICKGDSKSCEQYCRFCL